MDTEKEKSEEQTQSTSEPVASATPVTESSSTDSLTADNTVDTDKLRSLEDRLKAVNSESAQRRLRIKELESEISALTGLHSSETEELKSAYDGRLEALEQKIKEQVQALSDGIPAHLMPLIDNLPVIEQLDYLTKHRSVLLSPTAPSIDGASRSTASRKGRPSSEELAEIKRRRNDLYRSI